MSGRTEFQARRWLRVLSLCVLALFLAGFVFTFLREGVGWLSLGFAALVLMGLGGVAESLLVRVSLLDDALRIRTLLGRRRVPRESIAKVSWEGGSGVAVQLHDGAWIKLPEMGQDSQGLANSIRAWLRRTERGA